jgi:hypothetical protein
MTTTEGRPMNELYRQGDILLRRVERIPLRRRRVETGEQRTIVLAHGELTGHRHEIEAAPDEARIRQGRVGEEERTFLEVLAPSVRLRHDEHAEIELPQGEYEIVRQREYDPEAAREARRVAD